ncbi:CHRD domain-containing protein [Methylobacterium sp. WL12]|uniref:CHRD domain-containing protein n=1 Tax=Methylobacterium sp. WL12 TaxID=2603890 RepID=UPI0011C8E951|nr:CHRD domain-containing protein [Methylobacterium sp. WL12]TXM70932.1 CHRD domain-containing protein [Methylobacterium sp. WL12]
MIHDIRSGLAALALSAFALSATVATASAAEGQTYKAALTAGSEVPATESKGTGEVSATYDPAGKTLTWKGSYSGLTGPVTAAHFHGPAEAGANAGVLVPVTASASPFEGSATLDDAKAADLAAGKIYFNLHTAANPKGEIRGQVVRAP